MEICKSFLLQILFDYEFTTHLGKSFDFDRFRWFMQITGEWSFFVAASSSVTRKTELRKRTKAQRTIFDSLSLNTW